MPRTEKTLNPHNATTRTNNRKGVKPTFKVGQTYLYRRERTDGGEIRSLVTVIDRKVTGKVTTIAVIAVTAYRENDPKVSRFRPDQTEIIRGIRVMDTECNSGEFVEWAFDLMIGSGRFLSAKAEVKNL